ncbi:MAG: hypothetical protein C0404_10335 [Verrucomicrobia bacterium]|nr:hypothetical protein [Verrucomicrobiota bacterium]
MQVGRRVSGLVAGGLLLLASNVPGQDRINHEGRILGTTPAVTNAILFNTAAADAVISTLQIQPADSPWNEDISGRPLLANSAAMMTMIYNDLASNRRTLRVFTEMNYVLVPSNQPLVPIEFVDYPDESDPPPYPIPSNMPIETWPVGTSGETLYEWQVDTNNVGGDRHAIIVQPSSGDVWEMWQTRLVGTNWQSSNGAKFNIYTNGLRPDGWTSGDAAGLSMFPALIRYDECERGVIEHAMRLIVKRSRKAYIYPAQHYASTNTNVDLPAMGQRMRLKAGFSVPGSWTKQEKAVCAAFKKYGAIVADNGGFFSISAVPDDRFPAGCFDNLATISVTNFEVIATTGLTGGPRSPGKPVVNAGTDMTVDYASLVTLNGRYTVTGGVPVVEWRKYSGPGSVVFTNAALTNTAVSFGSPGTYTLMLGVKDGLHSPQYDAVTVNVQNNFAVDIGLSGASLALNWQGAYPPFVVERNSNLLSTIWTVVQSNNSTTFTASLDSAAGYFRVRGK